ncbi:MAG: hypothetical protein AAF740_01010 [Bacteroidota bacterium]
MLTFLLLASIFTMTFFWVRSHKPAFLTNTIQKSVQFINRNYKLFLLIGLFCSAWATYNWNHSVATQKTKQCPYKIEYRIITEENNGCQIRTIVVKDNKSIDGCLIQRSEHTSEKIIACP